ncbi:MAG: TRAP transporter fused permease subunit [Deltaproteobacteria bacterium]|nr:MAG: TRAP transporter fused permease subunit [Deltaproteobacteria bacterium]
MKTKQLREIISIAFFVYCVVVILKLPFYFGAYLATPQLLAGGLLFTLLLHLLTEAPRGKATRWIDALPLGLGLPGAIFIAFFYNEALDYEAYGFLDAKGIALAFSLAVALITMVYRRTAWAMPALIVVLLSIVRFQDHLPGLLHGVGYDFSRLGYSFYMGTHGIFGVPFKVACTILISFIVFGRLFQAAGGGTWFLNLAAWLLGSTRGGMAKVAVMASAFFGMISGSPSANTASTGAITIPMMIRTGYKPSLAGAIEAVASTGGQFMPPVMGAIIFIMAEWLEIPYSSVAFMAALPAILYYIIVFSTIHFEALEMNRPVIARTEVIPFSQLLKHGWIYVVPLAALIVFLLVLKYDPEQSVLFSIPILIASSFLSTDKENRLNLARIYTSVVAGAETWLTVGAVTAAVGMVIGALTLSGLGVKISGFLIDMSGENLTLLLAMVGLASFMLGMGLDSIPCYITVAILTAPALMKVGVSGIAAHLFVIYWGLASFFTPPVCIAVYVACGISGAGVWETGWKAVRLGIGVFLIPFAFVLHPALLLKGSAGQVIMTGIIATGAAIAIGCGIAGYCLKRLNWVQRFMLIVGAISMILPRYQTVAIGLILVAASLLWQWLQKRQGTSIAEIKVS